MNTNEVLKLALEALFTYEDDWVDDGWGGVHHNVLYDKNKVFKAIAALQEALVEQPAQQEPVAWRWLYNGQPDSEKHFSMPGPDAEVISRASACEFPRTVQYLYTSPPAQPAQNDAARIDWLTNNPVAALDIFGHVKGADAVRWIRQEIDRSIEAHHNIKENT